MNGGHWVDVDNNWSCRTRYIDPESVTVNGTQVAFLIEGRRRRRTCKTVEQARAFGDKLGRLIEEDTKID